MILVGDILKAHGIRGNIKVKPYMDTPDSFFGIKTVSVDGKKFEIEKTSKLGEEFLLVKLKGVDDMNSAENLRGKKIFVNRSDMPALTDGKYYIADLIGMKVSKESGEIIGNIEDILQYGSADVLVVKGKKNVLFPFIKGVDKKIDFDEKLFVVSDDIFSEVAVYED